MKLWREKKDLRQQTLPESNCHNILFCKQKQSFRRGVTVFLLFFIDEKCYTIIIIGNNGKKGFGGHRIEQQTDFRIKCV